MQGTAKRIIAKRNLRDLKSRLKKRYRNALSSSAYADEILFLKYRLDRFPWAPPKPRTRVHAATLSNLKEKRRIIVNLPRYIDYYNSSNLERLSSCIERMNRLIDQGARIMLNFHATEKVTAAAMLSFLAEVDQSIKRNKLGYRLIAFNHPKEEKVKSVLKQIGFYDLLRKKHYDVKSFDDVVFWRHSSGVCSEPFLVNDTIQEIKKELEIKASKKLYRGFSEAMANSVEHAYSTNRCLQSIDKKSAFEKWWCFAGIKDDNLVVVICDKGVGIPKTLPITQKDILRVILEKMNLVKPTDAEYIKAASNLKETRTGLSNRGKGIGDMKAVIDAYGNGSLTIFSNRGRYMYSGNHGIVKELVFDYEHSVRGTIIEWSLPLNDRKNVDVKGKTE
jgi:hypothetical protein